MPFKTNRRKCYWKLSTSNAFNGVYEKEKKKQALLGKIGRSMNFNLRTWFVQVLFHSSQKWEYFGHFSLKAAGRPGEDNRTSEVDMLAHWTLALLRSKKAVTSAEVEVSEGLRDAIICHCSQNTRCFTKSLGRNSCRLYLLWIIFIWNSILV